MKKIRVELSEHNLDYINNNKLSVTKTINLLIQYVMREDAPGEVIHVKNRIISEANVVRKT